MLQIDLEHQCSTPEITKAYGIDSSNNNIWNSMAALQGYADLARLALQSANQLQDKPRDQMQGVDDLITAVLSDYKTVVRNQIVKYSWQSALIYLYRIAGNFRGVKNSLNSRNGCFRE